MDLALKFNKICYLINLIIWRILFFLIHYLCAIIYWGKGKTVPPIQNSLLFKSANKLAEEIRAGKLKSKDVVQAYINRILEVEPYINAVVKDRFKEALDEAKEVDLLVNSGNLTSHELAHEKPLLGVPFTVKSLINVKGFPSTGCCKVFKDLVASEDAPSVTSMKKAGAIVLAISNSGELGLAYDSNNLLYGKTCNPYDTSRSPGGSSGGESALIGSGASVIGLGNDFAGSVRIPAHMTGIFSHKPSPGLISNSGCFPYPHPDVSYMLQVGPMCRYSEDLITLMNILTSENEKKINFNKKVDFSKLKIYYWMSTEDFMIHPYDKDIIAAMNKAISHFTDTYGAVTKDANIPLLKETRMIVHHNLQTSMPNLTEYVTMEKVKNISVFELVKYLLGKSTFSLWAITLLKLSKVPFAYDAKWLSYYQEVQKKLEESFDNLLDENSVFICPTCPVSGPYHYELIPFVPSTTIVGIFNVLGLPATNCPLGFNRNGMPQGMQIVGRKDNDALTVACANELSKVFGGWYPPTRK